MANSFIVTLTPEQTTELYPKLAELGISVVGQNYIAPGTLPEVDGVQLSYVAIRGTNLDVTITFTVDKKPFYVSMDAIEAHVKALINGN